MVRQLVTFGAIGVVSTVAYVVLYAVARTWLPATVSNALALVVTAVGNTAANRRLTFGVRGPEDLGRHHLAGLTAFGLALLVTSASLVLLHVLAPTASRTAELIVLVAANLAATALRFVVLRRAIRRPRLSLTPASTPERSLS